MARKTTLMSDTPRQDPVVEAPGAYENASVPAQMLDMAETIAPASASSHATIDQLSRIEEKTARIEEKFARNEAVFARAQDSLERSAARVEAAARNVDAAELAHEVAALRARVDQTPRFAALALTSLITAVVTTVMILATVKFFPGLIK